MNCPECAEEGDEVEMDLMEDGDQECPECGHLELVDEEGEDLEEDEEDEELEDDDFGDEEDDFEEELDEDE